jgi:hypothetical protein
LPTPGIRRLLWGLGAVGVLTFCFGCSFFMNNQFAVARALLIAANVVLIPLFAYLIMVRSRASAQYRRRLRKREQQKQQKLEALGRVDEMLEANDE